MRQRGSAVVEFALVVPLVLALVLGLVEIAVVARAHRLDHVQGLRSDPYTEHPTGEGKLYVCCIKDVWSNRIVGYSISDRMTAQLAVGALRNAVTLRSPGGTVLHSDRGSQFRSGAFVAALREVGLVGSIAPASRAQKAL